MSTNDLTRITKHRIPDEALRFYERFNGELPARDLEYLAPNGKKRVVSDLYVGDDLIKVNNGHKEYLEEMGLTDYIVIGDDEHGRKFIYNIIDKSVCVVHCDTYCKGDIERHRIAKDLTAFINMIGLHTLA